MNPNAYSPAAGALILSPDPLGSALLGAAVELAGFTIVFPQKDETPRDAVLRIRPAMLLIDANDTSAIRETVLGPAMMTGARLFLFGSAERTTQLRPLVERYRLEVIVLPRDVPRLTDIFMPRRKTPPEPVRR